MIGIYILIPKFCFNITPQCKLNSSLFEQWSFDQFDRNELLTTSEWITEEVNTLVNQVCAFIHSQQIGQVILLTESTVSNNSITQYTCFAHSHSPEIARPAPLPLFLSLSLCMLSALLYLCGSCSCIGISAPKWIRLTQRRSVKFEPRYRAVGRLSARTSFPYQWLCVCVRCVRIWMHICVCIVWQQQFVNAHTYAQLTNATWPFKSEKKPQAKCKIIIKLPSKSTLKTYIKQTAFIFSAKIVLKQQ